LDVFDVISRRPVVRQEAARQLFIELQLIIRQKADDRADAGSLGLF
jgi:hypothetical protein